MTYPYSFSSSSLMFAVTLFLLLAPSVFANPDVAQGASQQTFVIETNMKTIHCHFVADETPYSKFFREQIAEGEVYRDTTFCRVVPGLYIHGGCGETTRTGFTLATFKRSLSNYRAGALSLLKNKDGTFGPQFLILDDAMPWLTPKENPIVGFCESKDVISEVARVPTLPQGQPRKNVSIITIRTLTSSSQSNELAK